jgi:hypothetical protein
MPLQQKELLIGRMLAADLEVYDQIGCELVADALRAGSRDPRPVVAFAIRRLEAMYRLVLGFHRARVKLGWNDSEFDNLRSL